MGSHRIEPSLVLQNAAKAEKDRTLGLFDLTILGVGAIIGTGILVLTGIVAAQDAGPAVTLSFLIAATASCLIGLCYAELTTSIPNSGGAYIYTWVSIGRLPAFFTGWTLLGVYVATTATVANGWTGYVKSFLYELNVHLPSSLLVPAGNGGLVNLPAVIMVLLITLLLMQGTGQSKFVNDCLVCVKLIVILLFIVVSIRDVNPVNWRPYFPYGAQGVMTGAGAVFFSFLGFDALATSAEDAQDVQHSIPRAIVYSLVISTTLYIIVGLIMTGVVKYPKLAVSEAMSYVLITRGHKLVAQVVSAGAILGIIAVVYAFIYAGSNIMKAMSRGGFLPASWSKLNERSGSPNRAILLNGCLAAALAGEFDLHYLALIANVGSLIVFFLVSLMVILLRKQYLHLARPFVVPGGKVVPLLAMTICIALLITISKEAWLAYIAWLVFGGVIYIAYSRHHVIA